TSLLTWPIGAFRAADRRVVRTMRRWVIRHPPSGGVLAPGGAAPEATPLLTSPALPLFVYQQTRYQDVKSSRPEANSERPAAGSRSPDPRSRAGTCGGSRLRHDDAKRSGRARRLQSGAAGALFRQQGG